MDKEFITYEQALALKELGFDEICLGMHIIGGLQLFSQRGFAISKGGYTNTDLKTDGVIGAPTFSQAFRWFRDKYNIHAEITWSPSYEYDPGEWSDAIYEITFVDVSYTKEWKAESPNMQRNDGNQLTYKEAEKACLDKLIEICKTKTRQ